MTRLLGPLLLPQRLTARVAARDHLAGRQDAFEPISDDMDALRAAFAATNDQLELLGMLRETLKPLVRDADEIREVIEPLETAAERVGRLAERLPGPGRRRAGLLRKP